MLRDNDAGACAVQACYGTPPDVRIDSPAVDGVEIAVCARAGRDDVLPPILMTLLFQQQGRCGSE